MILVTHLLGSGHLARALALADGVAAAGGTALVASGGRPAPQLAARVAGRGGAIELLQLPPVASDGIQFNRLLDAGGAPANAALMAARRDQLAAALARFQPTALVTELFPFGRRVLADEFLGVLAAAAAMTPRPAILASVRDILAPPSSEAKRLQAEDRLRRFYDAVLVHGDPAIAELRASWPLSDAMAPMLRYTGFVAPAGGDLADAPGAEGADEILVSAGGGSVGQPLFEAAADAAAAGAGGGRRWRLLVGGADAEARIAALRRRLPAGAPAVVEGVRPDFRALLSRAALSVGQAGYNTVLDVIHARVRAVLVPFEDGGETEQAMRAASVAARYGHQLMPAADLSAARLAQASDAALAGPAPTAPPPRCDGAREAARLIAEISGTAGAAR